MAQLLCTFCARTSLWFPGIMCLSREEKATEAALRVVIIARKLRHFSISFPHPSPSFLSFWLIFFLILYQLFENVIHEMYFDHIHPLPLPSSPPLPLLIQLCVRFCFFVCCLFFNTWSTVGAAHILLNYILPLEHGRPTRSLALKENGFFLSWQFPVAFKSLYRVGFQALIPSPCWDLVWLELVRVLDMRLSCCEFMRAVALLCPRTLCPCVFHCLWLIESFQSLFCKDSQTLGGGR